MLKEKATTDEWRENIEKELAWVRDVKAAVRAGEKLYLKFLDDEEPVMRDSAAYLLASLARPAPALADHIWKKFESEEDESVRAGLVLAFGRLAAPSESNRAPLLALLVNAKSKSIKLAASMSLVQLGPTEVPEDAIGILLDAAKRPEEFSRLEESAWGKVDGVELLTLNHLMSLDEKSSLATQCMLGESLQTQEDDRSVRVAELLLNLSFPTTIRRGATFDSLGERQKINVAIIVTTRSLWREKIGGNETESIKISQVLRSCGLPDKRDELIRFIGEPASPVLRPAKPAKRSGLGALLNRLFKSDRS
jgi:hypothetical protein